VTVLEGFVDFEECEKHCLNDLSMIVSASKFLGKVRGSWTLKRY
jgi:hypothetical protein